MKVNNLSFSLLALFLAIGSALISVKANSLETTPFVEYSTANTNNIYCSTVAGSSCINSGRNICKILVAIAGGAPVACKGQNRACSVVLSSGTEYPGIIQLPSDAQIRSSTY